MNSKPLFSRSLKTSKPLCNAILIIALQFNYIKRKTLLFYKKALFFHYITDIQCMASFRFTEQFEERLDALAENAGKTKTAFIVDAVNAYAVGNLPDSKLLDLLNQLKAENSELKAAVDSNHTLLVAILKELQNSSAHQQS